MSAVAVMNGHSIPEALPVALPQQPTTPTLLDADELDQALEVAQMVAEGADRLHLETLATRIRAQATRAVRELEQMRRLAADPAIPMWRVDQARTNAVDAAREVASLVRTYRKRSSTPPSAAPSGSTTDRLYTNAAPGETRGRHTTSRR